MRLPFAGGVLPRTSRAGRRRVYDEHHYLRSETLRELVAPKATASTDFKGLVHDLCLALEARGALVRGGARDCMMVRMADCIESGRRVYMLRRAVIDEAPEDW